MHPIRPEHLTEINDAIERIHNARESHIDLPSGHVLIRVALDVRDGSPSVVQVSPARAMLVCIGVRAFNKPRQYLISPLRGCQPKCRR